MVRNFPRTTRRRVIAALAASSVLLGTVAIPLASADELDERKQRVQGDINDTLEHLDQSSAELQAADAALRAAQAKLAAAEQHLAETRGELAAAEVLDRQMQAKLEAAVARLEAARAELAEGREKIAEQE